MFQENHRLFRKPPLLGPPLSLPDNRNERSYEEGRDRREKDSPAGVGIPLHHII